MSQKNIVTVFHSCFWFQFQIKNVHNSARLRKLETRLASGQVSELAFLGAATHSFGKYFDSLSSFIDEETNEDISHLDEEELEDADADAGPAPTGAAEVARNTCVVCLISMVTHIVLPCLHANICGNCAGVLLRSEQVRCPTCRSTATDIRQFFM